jgi:WD40 repeat protein
MRQSTTERYFVAGGPLLPTAPSYVERKADGDLLSSLRAGDICYVLTSRQMGKSSLTARTAVRLREQGIAVAGIDLTAIGQELTREQWYYSLLMTVSHRLQLREEMRKFWTAQADLDPVLRWTEALRTILVTLGDRRLVIFIDEIDNILALKFPTDEFFAAIRACYSRRAEDPVFSRVSFCLLGVASPSDLIKDIRLTPFNVGRRIELDDFTPSEASSFEGGLGHEEILGQAILDRVLHWTGGHPYLTQRLCQAIVERPEPSSPADVDELCESLFLSARAQLQDDNLAFVRDRVTGSGEDLAGLLDLYSRILHGRRVLDDKSNRMVETLRLAGLVRRVGRYLEVRNRIYATVFNAAWIAENMPGAEVRRQRKAFWRGVRRMALLATLFVVPICVSAGVAWYMYGQVTAAKRQLADSLYAADMFRAQRLLEDGQSAAVDTLLTKHGPDSQDSDRTGFEWHYIYSLLHGERLMLPGHPGKVYCVAYSPDGHTIAGGGFDGWILIWDTRSGKEINKILYAGRWIESLAFSPDGKSLAAAVNGVSGSVYILDTVTWKSRLADQEDAYSAIGLRYSHSGRLLAARFKRSDKGAPFLRIWDFGGAPRPPLKIPWQAVNGDRDPLAFSPDDRVLACAEQNGQIRLIEVGTYRLLRRVTFPGDSPANTIDFSPDGAHLAAGDVPGHIWVWDLKSASPALQPLKITVTNVVADIAFSPGGHYLAAACWDSTLHLWSFPDLRPLPRTGYHTECVSGVAFSPDGKHIATASNDRTVRVWDLKDLSRDLDHALLESPGKLPNADVAMSPGGRVAVTQNSDSVEVWEMQPLRRIYRIPSGAHDHARTNDAGTRVILQRSGYRVLQLDLTTRKWMPVPNMPPPLSNVEFEADGDTFIYQSRDGIVFWNLKTGRQERLIRHPVNLQTASGESLSYFRISHNGTMLAYMASGVVILYDLNANRQIGAPLGLPGQNGPQSILFSPDDHWLVVPWWGGQVGIWDISSRSAKLQAVIQGCRGLTASAAFSADKQTLATAGKDNVVNLWNVATWTEVARLKIDGTDVQCLAFTPNGNALVALTSSAVYLWHLSDTPRR